MICLNKSIYSLIVQSARWGKPILSKRLERMSIPTVMCFDDENIVNLNGLQGVFLQP